MTKQQRVNRSTMDTASNLTGIRSVLVNDDSLKASYYKIDQNDKLLEVVGKPAEGQEKFEINGKIYITGDDERI